MIAVAIGWPMVCLQSPLIGHPFTPADKFRRSLKASDLPGLRAAPGC